MSSRSRQLPVVSAVPVRSVSITSRLKMVTNTIRSSSRNELCSTAAGSDASKPLRLTSVASQSKSKSLSSTTTTTTTTTTATVNSGGNASSRPLWPSRSASHRVAPSKSATFKSLKDDMVSSTGTESSSSGVYSDGADSTTTLIKPPASRLRPPSTSSASRITTAVVKTASKLVRRPTTPNDQSVVLELRNENLQLKNQIDRLKYELEEKHKKEVAGALAEKEKQHQQQMEAKEAAWRAEAEARLGAEREAAERQLIGERLRHADEVRELGALHDDERQSWQRKVDALMQRVTEALADKERLEKNVRQEVENQVQAVIQRCNELKQETSSLQAVVEMRSQELRNVMQQLELAKVAANEVPTLRERNLTLTNTIEDLQAQLERKGAEERRLLAELARFEAGYKEATNKIRMLTNIKDQLEWRLQQRHQSPTHSYYADGERVSPGKVVPAMTSTPNETPKTTRKTFTYPPSGLSPIISENGADGENNNVRSASRKSSASSATTSQRRSSADMNTSSDADDVFNSPSATPTVRDVTKKNDSISYVLELGDEQPVLPASPWQRRRPLGRSYSLRAPKHSKSH